MSKIQYCRIDPFFGRPTPLLFAHRGGAREVPESTRMGFRHAIEVGADVLEADVQLTKDGEFVLWHGPELDNVRISGQPDKPSDRDEDQRKIYDYAWKDLHEQAWVADPYVKDLSPREIDLTGVPDDPNRWLMRFSDFLHDPEFKDIPINIELKKSFKYHISQTQRGLKDNLKLFLNILSQDTDRKMVVVSLHDDYIEEFRNLTKGHPPTALSLKEQLLFWLPWNSVELENRALETTYDEYISSEKVVKELRKNGGATYVFITKFFLVPALDKNEKIDEQAIFKILDRGVDGIMTDRPKVLRNMIDRWKEKRC